MGLGLTADMTVGEKSGGLTLRPAWMLGDRAEGDCTSVGSDTSVVRDG